MKWAYITWIFFHSFANKVNANFFKGHYINCCGLISYICNNLPCPVCKTHAIEYLRKNNIYDCKTKEDLQTYLWKFHNEVNKMLGKPIYSFKDLDIYNRSIFSNIVKKFLYEFSKPYYYTKTMNSWKRKKAGGLIKSYLKTNWVNFK